MSNSQGRHVPKGKKLQSRVSDRSSRAKSATPQRDQLDAEAGARGGRCLAPLDITPEADAELQRTIAALGDCATGNARLAALCSRYVAALDEKHRLAQRLREERALRTKVLQTKNRLVALCQRLQEQTLELRREACGNEWSPDRDVVNKRTPLGMVRKYVDFNKYTDTSGKENSLNNGESTRENDDSSSEGEEAIENKGALLSEGPSIETVSTADRELMSSTSLSKVEGSDLRMETQVAALMKATSVARISEDKAAGMKIGPNAVGPCRDRLSLVTVTRSDIPPTQGCPTDRRIGVSWASMDLTRR